MFRRVFCALAAVLQLACSSDGSGNPVEPCVVRGITLSQAQFAMRVADVVSVAALIDQSGCSAAPATSWSTSDASIVTVAGGTITAIGVGSATVTAKIDGRNEQASAAITVSGRVSSLVLTPVIDTIDVTENVQLSATITADPGTPPGIVWRSSDATRAAVSAGGSVTGVAAGEVIITAISTADTTKRASAVIVVRPRVLGVTVSPARDTLFVSESVQLNAAVSSDPGASSGVAWRSSTPTIATVNGSGLVTAIAAGQAEIVVESIADPARRAFAVIVVLPRVLGVSITPTNATIDVAGTVALVATVNADPGASTAVTWTSSDPQRATVSNGGVVTGVSMGTATITARSDVDPARQATATITVRPRVLGVAVTPPNATVTVGNSVTFVATVTGDAGISPNVTWGTSDASRATVSASGVVTGVSAGSATITARSTADPTRSASATITVSSPLRVLSVTVTPTNANLFVGSGIALNATVTGDPGVPTTVTWSTSAPSIATVSASGQVSTVGVGVATITAASTVDPERKASATINVMAASQAPQGGSLCFAIPTRGGGSRVAPPVTFASSGSQATMAGGLTCASTSHLDVVAGQSTMVFPLIDGGPTTATWQHPTNSPVATLFGDDQGLAIDALSPGSISIGASAGGQTATIALRVLATAPTGFCVALSSGGPCVSTTTIRAGQPLTVYGMAGGQPAAALWAVVAQQLQLPHHIGRSITFTPPAAGAYILSADPTTGSTGSGLVIFVTP